MDESVEAVRWIVVFFDREDKPIDVYEPSDPPGSWPIRARLARQAQGWVPSSTRHLTVRTEVRILDFTVGDHN
jgi:hypothetical protein